MLTVSGTAVEFFMSTVSYGSHSSPTRWFSYGLYCVGEETEASKGDGLHQAHSDQWVEWVVKLGLELGSFQIKFRNYRK